MFNIKQLLLHAYPNAIVEIATESDGVHQRVSLKEIDKNDADYVHKIMEGAGFFLQVPDSEVATFGVFEYSNLLNYDENSDTSFLELAEDEDSEEETDKTDAVETNNNNNKDTKSGDKLRKTLKDQAPEIDSDGRSFKILTTPEMHKFAMKVYTNMLGNNENMSNYGIFAYDLDNFLAMHKNTDPDFNEEDDEDGMSVPSGSSEKANYIKLNPFSDGRIYSLKTIEAASTLFNSDIDSFYATFGKYMTTEVANTKLISKIILGIIVKILSGAVGKAILAAWQRRNKGALETALYNLVKIIVNDWFPTDEFSFATETKNYGKYEFDQDYKYAIDLDDYTIEDSEKSSDYSNAEIALSPANVGILRLLVAVFIKMMAAAMGRMLIDAWIKRDKNKFKKLLTYMVLQFLHYTPFEKASTEPDLELTIVKDFSELAAKKEKSGRAALLSALMSSLSGKRGDKAAKLWDSGNVEGMADLMGQVTEFVLDAMPEDENSEDDESNNDESEDENTSDAEVSDENSTDDDSDNSDNSDNSEDNIKKKKRLVHETIDNTSSKPDDTNDSDLNNSSNTSISNDSSGDSGASSSSSSSSSGNV